MFRYLLLLAVALSFNLAAEPVISISWTDAKTDINGDPLVRPADGYLYAIELNDKFYTWGHTAGRNYSEPKRGFTGSVCIRLAPYYLIDRRKMYGPIKKTCWRVL